MKLLIRGEGVAAGCCARLLAQAGLHATLHRTDRPKLPALMLGETTQKLLKEIFERPDLFDGLPRIRQRVVAWGTSSQPVALPHSAVVVSEEELLNRIDPQLEIEDRSETVDPDWTIFAARPLPAPCTEHHFGSRMAASSRAMLKPGCDSDACWIESCEGGWLFLVPCGAEDAFLLSVGDSAEALLAVSRLVSEQIAELGAMGGTFPCHPRIAEPLGAAGWLACGTAALGFDPLCGDGTGNAAREAILGSAVIRAAVEGADVEEMVAHYRARLLAGFQKHLEACRPFYETGGSAHWWNQELDALHRGLAWCGGQLEHVTGFRYRLNGFALEPI